jgi:hypothetical protein
MRTYIVTDALVNTTGAAADVIDVCKMARTQLLASTYMSDSRVIRYKPDGKNEYEELGRFMKRAGQITPSFAVIRHWKQAQAEAGKTMGLQDYWQAMDICPKCKGNKGKYDFSLADQDWVLIEDCDHCKGLGVYVRPRDTKMLLIVREDVHSAEGKRSVDMTLEEGDAKTCMKCFRDIRGAYNDGSQFRIEQDGKIIAIQVHGEMLLLANVPPPEYFTPKWKQKQPTEKEINDAVHAKMMELKIDAYERGLAAGNAALSTETATAVPPNFVIAPILTAAGAWNND